MDDRAARMQRVHDARVQWLHELRNAMNALGVTVSLGRRLLERGDSDSAMDMLERTEDAWADCRALLAAGPDVIGVGASGGLDADVQWRSSDSTAPTSSGSTGFAQTSTLR
ncbi:hypothetical protein ACVWWW_000024 [Lysobacter sp. HA18]